MHESSSELLEAKLPCADCGSSDAKAVYTDGHTYCFSCGAHHQGDGHANTRRDQNTGDMDLAGDDGDSDTGGGGRKRPDLIRGGDIRALLSRKISQETCQKFGYAVAEFNGKTVQVAPYHDKDGQLVAQKVRFPNKDFTVLGKLRQATLFGQRLWRDSGKNLVITEGEIDALSYAEATDCKWPVVSVPNGADGAAKAIRANLEFVEGFERVVFMFDMDEPGQEAAIECAELLSPGKAFIAALPMKDANEVLKAGQVSVLTRAMWDAKVYRPDGIIMGDEITLEDLRSTSAKGYELPYRDLQAMLRGLRKGELTLLTAGTGIGKSTLAREIGYHLMMERGLRIGNIYLEESHTKTAQGFVAIHNNIPLGELRANPEALSDDVLEKSLDEVIRNGRCAFYSHFGSLESDHLLNKLRYFARGLDCDFIFLDHISIVVSGQTSSSEGERKDIDLLMTRLRSLIEETGVGVIAISHLKMVDGKSHEEGGQVSINHLRGSGTLKQIPDTIIALERDQQGDNSAVAKIRVLKNREWGDTGEAGYVRWHSDTGRLLHMDREAAEELTDDDGETSDF